MSLPTVSQNLVRLEEEQLIAKSGQFESSVGRRATAYAICPQARVAIGVEIQKETVRMLAVDLLGTVIQKTDVPLPYVNADSYYQALSRIVQDFIASLAVTDEQVLGIGLAVQALTSVDGRKITYGKILNFTGLEITAFSQYLKYPCRFVHDAKCAATTELWLRNDIGDAVYLSIGRHLGGAIIINNQIEMGKEGHSGTVEHMTIDRNGPSCYCGKNGCMETYCSVSALLEEGETLDHFFAQLRSGAAPFMARWDRFLDMLALSINNIHLVINREFIIGGHISPYLEEQDLHILHEKVHEKRHFRAMSPLFISAVHRKMEFLSGQRFRLSNPSWIASEDLCVCAFNFFSICFRQSRSA